MLKVIMTGRLTTLMWLLPLSRPMSTFTPGLLQKSINSVSRCQYTLLQRVNQTTTTTEHFPIGKFGETGILLKRLSTSSSSTPTPITEENMQIAVYEDIKDLPNRPHITLIDVREPDELKQTGVIQTSINIPLGEVANALNLNDEKFKTKYGRAKPSIESEIIFTCRSGKRAGTAGVVAAGLGYQNIKNYKGSWIEWAEREGLPVQ